MRGLKYFLLIVPFVLCALGILAAWIIESGKLSKWQPLGIPPGGAKEFADANATYVYVISNSGNLYRCPICWEQAVPLEKPLNDPDRICPPSFTKIPPVPGEVRVQLGGRECHADATTDYQYAILSDGSVWAWSHFRGSFGFFLYPILAGCGCLLGSVPVALFFIFSLSRKPPRPV